MLQPLYILSTLTLPLLGHKSGNRSRPEATVPGTLLVTLGVRWDSIRARIQDAFDSVERSQSITFIPFVAAH